MKRGGTKQYNPHYSMVEWPEKKEDRIELREKI